VACDLVGRDQESIQLIFATFSTWCGFLNLLDCGLQVDDSVRVCEKNGISRQRFCCESSFTGLVCGLTGALTLYKHNTRETVLWQLVP
jgi:hypothetical protein